MARPAKTLADHVRDQTFRPERHAGLLDLEELGAGTPRRLLELQGLYRAATSPRQRRAIVGDFARAVRGEDETAPRLTATQLMLVLVGPVMVKDYLGLTFDELLKLERAWMRWDNRWGLAFRAWHGHLGNTDVVRIAGRTDGDVAAAERVLPVRLEVYLRGLDREPPPPPGWRLLETRPQRRSIAERREAVRDLESRYASVDEIAACEHVSPSTIRRDFAALGIRRRRPSPRSRA